MSENSVLPAELEALSQQPRVTVRRAGPWRGGRAVVYWMQRAQRVADNPALDLAIAAANLLGLPVVVYFQVIPNYPNANLRHYRFLQQGLRDVAEDAAERGVGFVVRRRTEKGGATLEGFLAEVDAALVIGDENPCRDPEHWRQVLAARLKLPFWTVDADVVVPSKLFGRTYTLLHHFRPHLREHLDSFLVAEKEEKPLHPWAPAKEMESYPLDSEITEGFTELDRSVAPVDSFTGGTHRAQRLLARFIDEALGDYDEKRNHPELRGTSRLSPYLHFGQIGPRTIALAAKRAAAEGRVSSWAAEKFIEQVIGWRELSVLFVRHEPNYDNWNCAAPWARKTLLEHTGDERRRYSFEKLERGETHDELWNAAQREMLATGWMHNYMRMYWAKKILEWAPDPEHAFEWAVTLNDRYELDGRDANGYAGIAWAIVGRHDRPWFNRPVFGLVRPMSGKSLEKKFDARSYIRQNP